MSFSLKDETISYLQYELLNKRMGTLPRLGKDALDSADNSVVPRQYRILLVEDNYVEARLVAEFLDVKRSEQFILDRANDLKETREYLEKESYDAILLDLCLPDSISNIDTFKEVAQIDPTAAIIILSGDETEGLALAALEQGAQDYIPKADLDKALLKRSLFYAIQRQRLWRSLQLAERRADAGNQAKTEFLGMMSHEFRTSLNSLMGGLQLIRKKERIADCGECFDIVDRGLDELVTMVDQILNVTEIESDELIVDTREFVLSEVVTQAINRSVSAAARKRLTLTYSIADVVPERVVSDSNRLSQLLEHLLRNAITYTEKGSVVLSVSVNEGNRIQFSLADTGTGITEDFQERMYRPFIREEEAGEERHGGAGLGLAICKKISDAMDWDLVCESQKGAGTTFRFSVSQETEAAEAGSDESGSIEHSDAHPRNRLAEELPLNILIAEDGLANQRVIQMMLESLGYQSDIANDGYEAVKAAEEKHYDLVLMDIAMPHMDGTCSANIIRYHAGEEGAAEPYIVAVTASVSLSDQRKCLDLGMDAFIGKPVELNDLVHVIEQASAHLKSHS